MFGATENPSPSVEHAQLVMQFRTGGNCGAPLRASRPCFHGHRGTETLDGVKRRAVSQTQELTGVGGKGLNKAAAALGVDRVHGERTLAGP